MSLTGPDEQFISYCLIGADGGIGGTTRLCPLFLYNIVPIKKGENKKAADKFKNDWHILSTPVRLYNMYAVIKEAIKRMHVLIAGSVRPPLYPLVPKDEAFRLRVALIQAAEERLPSTNL